MAFPYLVNYSKHVKNEILYIESCALGLQNALYGIRNGVLIRELWASRFGRLFGFFGAGTLFARFSGSPGPFDFVQLVAYV